MLSITVVNERFIFAIACKIAILTLVTIVQQMVSYVGSDTIKRLIFPAHQAFQLPKPPTFAELKYTNLSVRLTHYLMCQTKHCLEDNKNQINHLTTRSVFNKAFHSFRPNMKGKK